MSKESVIVEANYGTSSVWIECDGIELTNEELELLSTALWKYRYQVDFELNERSNTQWEFIASHSLLESISKKVVEIIQELFPNKVIKSSVENKYD